MNAVEWTTWAYHWVSVWVTFRRISYGFLRTRQLLRTILALTNSYNKWQLITLDMFSCALFAQWRRHLLVVWKKKSLGKRRAYCALLRVLINLRSAFLRRMQNSATAGTLVLTRLKCNLSVLPKCQGIMHQEAELFPWTKADKCNIFALWVTAKSFLFLWGIGAQLCAPAMVLIVYSEPVAMQYLPWVSCTRSEFGYNAATICETQRFRSVPWCKCGIHCNFHAKRWEGRGKRSLVEHNELTSRPQDKNSSCHCSDLF